MSVDLHVAANGHVRDRDELHVLVHVLVLATMEELALDDAGVLLSHLVDANRVVSQEERDDEAAVDVLGHTRVESRCEAKNLLVVVNKLEEVLLGFLGLQTVGLTLAVLFVTEAVVGWVLNLRRSLRLRELHLAERELISVALEIEALRGLVDTLNDEDAAVGVDVRLGRDLVASQVVVANKVLAWLVDVVAVWELRAAQVHREGVSAIVGAVVLADLESVISQVVVHGVRQVVTSAEESQDLSIEVKELLLGVDLAATKRLLHEVLHLRVVLAGHCLLRSLKVVLGLGLGRWQLDSLFLYKAFES